MIRAIPLVLALALAPAAQAAVPAVQSHRGGPVIGGVPTYPEESMPAFRNAAQNLHTVLELDTKLTEDRVPVVIHDDTLERTTNCEGLVADRTLAELAECKGDVLGAPGNDLKTAPAPVPVPIPTLAEVLAFAKAEGIGINLEIKNYVTDDDHDPTPAFATRVMEVVLESKIPAKQVIIQSFTPDNLDVAERMMPDAEIALLALAGFEDLVVDMAETRGWEWVSPSWPVSKEYVEDAHSRNIRVVPYTINQRDDVKAARDAGVDALITDDPLMALRTLDTTRPKVKFEVLTKRIRAVRRRGRLAVRVSSNEASVIAFNVRLAGRRVGVREVRLESAGARKVTLRVRRAVRRSLKGKRTARVRLASKWRDLAFNDGNSLVFAKLR